MIILSSAAKVWQVELYKSSPKKDLMMNIQIIKAVPQHKFEHFDNLQGGGHGLQGLPQAFPILPQHSAFVTRVLRLFSHCLLRTSSQQAPFLTSITWKKYMQVYLSKNLQINYKTGLLN